MNICKENEKIIENWISQCFCSPELLIVISPFDKLEGYELVKGIAAKYIRKIYKIEEVSRRFLFLKYPGSSSRFFESPGELCRFKNEFNGVFAVDITDYKNNFLSEDFMDLMEYVTYKRKRIRFVFTILSKNSEIEVSSHMNKFFPMQTLDLTLNKIEHTKLFLEKVKEKGIIIDASGIEYLENMISVISKSNYFQGVQTIESLANSMVFQSELINIKNISFEFVKSFFEGYEFSKKNKIGF